MASLATTGAQVDPADPLQAPVIAKWSSTPQRDWETTSDSGQTPTFFPDRAPTARVKLSRSTVVRSCWVTPASVPGLLQQITIAQLLKQQTGIPLEAGSPRSESQQGGFWAELSSWFTEGQLLAASSHITGGARCPLPLLWRAPTTSWGSHPHDSI